MLHIPDQMKHIVPSRLHIERYGKRDKPLVILLHGIATSGKIWQPMIDELGDDYYIVTIDLLGHGLSPKPTNVMYSADEHIRAIRWTLFTHGLWRPAIFVGFSIGALISARLAAHYPHMVKALILAAPPIYRSGERVQTQNLDGLIDGAYLAVYRTLRRIPKRVVVRSADFIERRAPKLLGTNRMDEHTWYPIVSTLRYTIEQQTTSQDIQQWSTQLPVQVFCGKLDHLVMTANVERAFALRPQTQLHKLTAPHSLTSRYVSALSQSVRSLT